jgi:hypothetical protein
MEIGAVIFEVDIYQGNSKILQLICQVLILWVLKKMKSPTMSKNYVVWSKKHKEF